MLVFLLQEAELLRKRQEMENEEADALISREQNEGFDEEDNDESGTPENDNEDKGNVASSNEGKTEGLNEDTEIKGNEKPEVEDEQPFLSPLTEEEKTKILGDEMKSATTPTSGNLGSVSHADTSTEKVPPSPGTPTSPVEVGFGVDSSAPQSPRQRKRTLRRLERRLTKMVKILPCDALDISVNRLRALTEIPLWAENLLYINLSSNLLRSLNGIGVCHSLRYVRSSIIIPLLFL